MEEKIIEVADSFKRKVSELQSEQEKLAAAIDQRLEKINARSDDGQKALEETKGEIQNLVRKYNEIVEQEEKARESMQKQIDDLSGKITLQGKKPQNMKSAVIEQIEKRREEFSAFTKGRQKSFLLELDGVNFKADMTRADNYTGDVFGEEKVPGFIFDPDRPVHIRSYINTSPTSQSAQIVYWKETGYTDGTATISEAGSYGQTEIDLTETKVDIEKIGAYATVTMEMIEDTPGLTNFLSVRMNKKLLMVEDTQLLSGTGTSPQLDGLITNGTAYQGGLADENINYIDVISKAATEATVDHYRPNVAFISPTAGDIIRRTKDADGMYVFPQAIAGANFTINGVRIVETTAMPDADTFVVMDGTMAATLFDRMTPTIQFATEHSTNFLTDKVTVKVTERLALAIYRPTAIITGSFAAALAEGSA